MTTPPEKPAYTVAEVAKLMGFSMDTVIRIFQDERGVLIRKHPETQCKRRYRSTCIPRAVYARVVNRLSVK